MWGGVWVGVCLCVCHFQTNLSLFENGCDVTVYFMLSRTEMCVLLSVCGKFCAQLQKGAIEVLSCMKRRVMMSHQTSMWNNI